MKSSKTLFSFYIIVVTSLFVYIILRAKYVGFAHDEAYTFQIFGGSGIDRGANTHWLNTVSIFFSSFFFGKSELTLRLPNVLSFLIYSYFCYKLVIEKSFSTYISMMTILFLMFNPYLTEFFSLARGYGMATAFFAGSLYYFMLLFEDIDNEKVIKKAIVFSALTIYSNYSYAIPILAINLTLLIKYYPTLNQFYKINFKNRVFNFFFFQGLVLLPAFANIIYLKIRKQLYIGGKNNIVLDTIFPFFNTTFLYKIISYQNEIILTIVLLSILIGILIHKNSSLKFSLIIIISIILIPTIANLIMGMNFPVPRGALYWVVVLGFFFFTLLRNLSKISSKNLYYGVSTAFTITSLLIIFGFTQNMNLKYTSLWKYDADNKSMVKKLETILTDEEKERKIDLGIDWHFEPSINYYREAQDYDFINPVTREGLTNKTYDYYYYFNNQELNLPCLEIISYFSNNNTKLTKNCQAN